MLCNLSPVLTEIIGIMGLQRKFHIYGTEQEAMDSF